jgi:hypothetical protein
VCIDVYSSNWNSDADAGLISCIRGKIWVKGGDEGWVVRSVSNVVVDLTCGLTVDCGETWRIRGLPASVFSQQLATEYNDLADAGRIRCPFRTR